MRVAVKDGADAVAVDRLFEPARSEIRKDFRRLAFHRRANRRVVQHRDALLRAQPGERGFELQRLVDRLLHERFDRVLAPRARARRGRSRRQTP